MAARIIQLEGNSVRAWFSNEQGPVAQEGEMGYLLDTQQRGIYRNGNWIFSKSERQVLQEIQRLLEEAADRDLEVPEPADPEPPEDPGVVVIGPVPVPVTVFASAYASGDAFGNKFVLEGVPEEGTISNVLFFDRDDEGLSKELVLFKADFTGTADDAAFAVTDADMANCIGVVSITNFYNFGANQIGQGTPALSYRSPAKRLWCQMVTRGADNIAAGMVPDITLVILQ